MENMKSNKSGESMGRHARPANGAQQQTPSPNRSQSPTPRGGYRPVSEAYAPAGADIGGSRFASRKTVIAFAIVIALLVVAYACVGFFFSTHFYPGSTLGTTDISLKSSSEVQQLIDGTVSEYELTVQGDGLEFTVSSADAGASLDSAKLVEDLLSQNNPALWPLGLASSHDYSEGLALTTAGGGLGDLVRSEIDAFNETAEPSQDATVQYDSSQEAFAVVPEVYGTQVNADAVIDLVGKAVANMDRSVAIGEEQFVKPSILQDDERLVSACDGANAMLRTNLTFTVAGTTAATLAAADIAPWVTIGEDYTVSLDQNAVSVWADGAAGLVNTYGSTRNYTRPDGKACSVSGGVYGWIADKETLVNNVIGYVQSGTVGTFEIPMTQTAGAFNGVGKEDWGSRYIDVDLSEQHARFYDGGSVIWESDVVSGKPDPEMATPTGVYVLNDKQSPSTLIGSMVPETGKPEYETKVEYWMPFVGNSVGFHDATWQSAFGGSRYAEGYGSHGCVNLPLDAAGSLYGLIAVGDVIVVHN